MAPTSAQNMLLASPFWVSMWCHHLDDTTAAVWRHVTFFFMLAATIFLHCVERIPSMKLQNSYMDYQMSSEPLSKQWLVNGWNIPSNCYWAAFQFNSLSSKNQYSLKGIVLLRFIFQKQCSWLRIHVCTTSVWWACVSLQSGERAGPHCQKDVRRRSQEQRPGQVKMLLSTISSGVLPLSKCFLLKHIVLMKEKIVCSRSHVKLELFLYKLSILFYFFDIISNIIYFF